MFNDRGPLLNVALTAGNVDDRKPVPRLGRDLFGKLWTDRGDISKKLGKQLKKLFDLPLITKLRSNAEKSTYADFGQTLAAQTSPDRNH